MYQDKGDFKTALEYLKKSLEMFNRLFNDQDHKKIAYTYNSIGCVYQVNKDFDTALEYLNKALEMLRFKKDSLLVKITKN